ncbi:hypothetical protein ON010_g9647 [Phytophthora cinnamomi]|nr:hypothetical protein ON010_g9647 [Phytophthora cinnamomi]
MASDFEYDGLDDVDAICGWGAADFDDELLGRNRRRAPAKSEAKRKPEKALANSSSGAALLPLANAQQQQHDTTGSSPEKKRQALNGASEKKERPVVLRKPKRKQPHEPREFQHQTISQPSPRTSSILEENAAIAALGRQRRMKVVAAAMAANVPRRQGLASVVSAYFDGNSDDEQVDAASPRRCSDELLPSSAPQNQQEKLPRVAEPSTAPTRSIDVPKTIHPPLSLPLLSINPKAGGNETRLPGKDERVSQAPRHWRRQRKQENSLLPSRDVSEHWESNFPPNLRRVRSPRKYQVGVPDATSGVVSSSFTRNSRVPLVHHQQVHDTKQRAKESLPLIRHTNKELKQTVSTDTVDDGGECDKNDFEEKEENAEDDDESWTRSYDDPEAITKSMAGLIQALSTFGKHTRSSKAGRNRKRRAKVQQQQQQQQWVPVNAPILRLPLDGEVNIDPGISSIIAGGLQGVQASDRRRKHRRLRNKQWNDVSHHDQVS